MTRKNLIQRKELMRASSEERDHLLCSTYGFTIDDLRHIRREATLAERVIEAMPIFFDLLKSNKKVYIGDRGAQVTSANVMALVHDDWDNPEKKEQGLNQILARWDTKGFFDHDRIKTRLKPTRMHYLRKKFGFYHGNLEEASNTWKHFTPSKDDWVMGTRIPTDLGLYEGILIGILIAKGLTRDPVGDPGAYYIYSGSLGLRKRNHPKRKFMNTVVQLIRKQYNLLSDIYPLDNGTKERYGGFKLVPPNTPVSVAIEFSSMALTTWLTKDLGFRKARRSSIVPINYPAPPEGGFGLGYAAGLLTDLTGEANESPFRIRATDKTYVNHFYEVMRKQGSTCNLVDENNINMNDKAFLWKMLHQGYLVNPDVAEKVRKYFRPDISVLDLEGKSVGQRVNHLYRRSHIPKEGFSELFKIKDINGVIDETASLTQSQAVSIGLYFGLDKKVIYG